MKLRLVLAITVAISAPLSAQSAPATVTSSARFIQLGDSLTPAASRTAQLGRGPGYTFALTHRDSSGGVEAHRDWTDMFVIESGSATLVSGGTLSGASESSAGEWRGGSIVGATSSPLRVGDVVVIPAGTPHQMTLTAGEKISYLAFKIAKPANTP